MGNMTTLRKKKTTVVKEKINRKLKRSPNDKHFKMFNPSNQYTYKTGYSGIFHLYISKEL